MTLLKIYKQERNLELTNKQNRIFKHIYQIIFIEDIGINIETNNYGKQTLIISYNSIIPTLKIKFNNKKLKLKHECQKQTLPELI